MVNLKKSQKEDISKNGTEYVQAQLQRTPKIGVFIFLGAALGLIVGAVLTFVFPIQQQFSRLQVFGFLSVFCIVIGAALFAAIALILLARTEKKQKTATFEIKTEKPENNS